MSKAKQAIYLSSSDDAVDDDEDEEESDSYLGQEDEEDDNESEEEEEEPECTEEEYEDEESESDQEVDEESDGISDEDEDYESFSEDESNDDDHDKGYGRKEGKLTDEDLCDKVFNLLRQRNKKLDVLKLEECKAYLRKHELMISGAKATCIQRILEHWRLKDGNGERLYPKSLFTINCTGDVCKGDVVMFKQRVYAKFNKVSRNGKVIGKRTIAGRVVKESYGSAKQQHTFTIEVLWSKGVKSLPTLYPLLVKGRNLYRYRTFRQKWGNEVERSKVLEEKHRRGATARHVKASTKARISAGSKRQRTLSDSKQQQIKRLKKHSEAPTPRKKQQTTLKAKSQTKHSNNKHRESSSSANHSNKFKTKPSSSSTTNMRQISQPETEASKPPLHFSTQRPPNFQNIYGNLHPHFLQISNKPSYNYSLDAAHAVRPMNRGRNIGQSQSAYASPIDGRGHLSHNYSSQYDSRSSGHFFTPAAYDPRYANFYLHGRSQPWP